MFTFTLFERKNRNAARILLLFEEIDDFPALASAFTVRIPNPHQQAGGTGGEGKCSERGGLDPT